MKTKTPRRSVEQRKRFLERMIKQYGSAYKASQAMGIKPSAFYERMKRVGMKPKGYPPLDGEPRGKRAKKLWLTGIIQKNDNNMTAAAVELGISISALRSRMSSYKIKSLVKPLEQRKREFSVVFKRNGRSAVKTAKELGVTVSAVYERLGNYDLTTPLQDKFNQEMELIK